MRKVCFLLKAFFRQGMLVPFFLGAFSSFPLAARSLQEGVFIRDAEIEATLHDYLAPIFKVAGLDPRNLKLYLIISSEVNAAASLGYSIFMNTGLLLESKTPEQIIGVLAHETGHIAGGHLSRLQGALEKTSLASMAALVLGSAAALAGAGDVALASILGGMSMAQGAFFHYSRGQEGAADSAGVRYLEALGWSSQGLLEFMQTLAKQEYLSPDQQEGYMRTHPFSRDRVNFLQEHVKTSPYSQQRLPKEFYEKYQRMMAKLRAYLESPGKTLLLYGEKETSSAACYGRAIALYRANRFSEAMDLLNDLIRDFPNDAYFHELKGQWMFEQGQLDGALVSYQKALELDPEAPLIRLAYAQTLIEKNQSQGDEKAIVHLRQVLALEKETPLPWRLLAIAYGRQGKRGLSSLALAEEALVDSKPKIALLQAKRARHALPPGPDKLRATDIQALAERLLKEAPEE